MDAIDLIRYQSRQAWSWLNMTVSDVTEEQANWQPPGHRQLHRCHVRPHHDHGR